MIRRPQIEQIVKLFKFEKRGEDSYYLKLFDTTIFLYYFRTKCPDRGHNEWQIEIYDHSLDRIWVYALNNMQDFLIKIIEHFSRIAVRTDRSRMQNEITNLMRKYSSLI